MRDTGRGELGGRLLFFLLGARCVVVVVVKFLFIVVCYRSRFTTNK